MFRILVKKKINPQVVYMELEAPHVVENARAGQFVVIRIDEKGERIPLTIVDKSKEKGAISLIFQEAGKTTKKLSAMNSGDGVKDVIGPLGRATDIEKVGNVICIGGGVGTAEIYSVTRAFKKAGNEVISIIGARNKELLLLADEMKAISSQLYIATDDGSAGRKGFVTDILKELLEENKNKYALVYAVGPILMMKAAAVITKEHNLKTVISLNSNMVDATGMCGTCRVTVGGQTKFTCVDGPDFDAHQVDFGELINRDRRFKDKEEEALRRYEETTRGKKS
ncbi:MAG: sulfide/dihydroorotate dehydrogenase-like FAD/NAD-binding protein [Candidatus Omnitrophota bacterium]|nr:sulfide/dihydroorotate dehydrogenase-like FAD/NAD-binding protein [Candidatus Omnitrophota bacterium]